MFPASTRFLLIEDSASMRKVIKKILVELGFSQIDEAPDATSALQMIQDAHTSGQPYGFIISDCTMQEMRGIEFLKLCKSRPHSRQIPFMLVVSQGEQKQMLEAARAGVSDFVVMPFNAPTLKSKLEKIYLRMKPSAAKAA